MTTKLVTNFEKMDFRVIAKALGLKTKIPYDWEVCRQGDICEFINGYAYSLSEFRKIGYLIIRIQNLTGGNNYVYSDLDLPEKQFVNSGDLLFAWSATFGPYIWNGPKASYHYHIWKLKLNEEEVDKRFVYYHLDRISERIKIRGQSGLGMVHMTKSGMERFPFLKPPLKEQQKIASILSRVDELIQKTDQIIEQAQRLKKGLMQKLLTRGIGHTKFKQTKLGEIPEDWSIDEIQNHSKITTGAKNTQDRIEGGRYPFFVRSQKIERINTYSFDGEAVLTAGDGVGTGKVFHYINGKFDFHQRVYKISKFSDHLYGYFFYLYFSNYFLPRITSMSAKTSVDSVRMDMIAKMLIPLPAIKEQ